LFSPLIENRCKFININVLKHGANGHIERCAVRKVKNFPKFLLIVLEKIVSLPLIRMVNACTCVKSFIQLLNYYVVIMLKSFWNEEWKDLELIDEDKKPRKKYAVSNYGRVVSYTDNIENGKLLKFGVIEGYHVLTLCHKLKYSRCVHKLVAQYFLPEPETDQNYVIHYDFDKQNNSVKNLQWASREQLFEHQNHNPKVQHARKNHTRRKKGPKLTENQVKRLKKIINDPDRKRTYKQIAKRYGISVVLLHRIKNGRDWAHVN